MLNMHCHGKKMRKSKNIKYINVLTSFHWKFKLIAKNCEHKARDKVLKICPMSSSGFEAFLMLRRCQSFLCVLLVCLHFY